MPVETNALTTLCTENYFRSSSELQSLKVEKETESEEVTEDDDVIPRVKPQERHLKIHKSLSQSKLQEPTFFYYVSFHLLHERLPHRDDDFRFKSRDASMRTLFFCNNNRL